MDNEQFEDEFAERMLYKIGGFIAERKRIDFLISKWTVLFKRHLDNKYPEKHRQREILCEKLRKGGFVE